MSNNDNKEKPVKDQKSIENRPVVLFKKNRIYAVNTTEYQVELVISQEPHTYEIIDKKLVVKGVTYLKFPGKTKKDIDPKRHEIVIDGIKAYVSLFIYSEIHKSIGAIFTNRLIKKEQILTIKESHLEIFLSNLNKDEPPTVIYPIENPDTTILLEQNIQQNNNLKKFLLENPPKDFTQSKMLGAGSFSVVYLGFLNDTKVAVKKFRFTKDVSYQLLEIFFNEVNILKHLDHPNIVKYIYSCVSTEDGVPTYLNIFLEYCPGGSIADIIWSNNPLPESIVSKFTKQILLAIKYLHENDIIHRDIKGSNILLDENGNIKLSDFGSSKIFEDEKLLSTLVGTVDFIAPEVINGEYGRLSDIWSLGCTVVQMITSKTPQIVQITAIKGNLKSGIPHIPLDLNDDIKDFLSLCLKVNPKERSTAAQLLNHRFITNYNS